MAVCGRSDGVGTVTQEEKEKFAEIKERLRVQLEYQLTNFRFCFPFGRPEGALKSTLSLLERVMLHFDIAQLLVIIAVWQYKVVKARYKRLL